MSNIQLILGDATGSVTGAILASTVEISETLLLESGSEVSGSLISADGQSSLGKIGKPWKDAFLTSSLFIDGRKVLSIDEARGIIVLGGPNNEDVLINASGSGKVIITNNLDMPSGSISASAIVVERIVSPAGGAITGTLFGTASFAESASFAPSTPSDSASFSETSSFAGRAQAAPMAIVINTGQPGFIALELEDQETTVAEIPKLLRMLVDLTGFKEARLVSNIRKYKQADVYLAMQYSFDYSPVQPEESWSFLDGGGGPSITIDGEGIKTDGWFPLTGSAKTDIVLRAVASHSPAVTESNVHVGAFGLFVR